MKRLRILIILVATLCVTGCVTPKKVNYLQDLQQGSQIALEHRFEAVVHPYDELTIQISSSDEELAKPFEWNLRNHGSNIDNAPGYLVDVDGNIELPVLGKIKVAGMTRLQIQDTITTLLRDGNIIAEPFVMVRFRSFKIFFLGATENKAITIPNERCTFLEALALAGDLGVYTNRGHIMVLREENGKMNCRFLDPRSSDVMNDPYYMLQQNDIIVTDVYSKETTRNEAGYWMGWVSAIVSVSSLAISILIYMTVK